MLENKKWGSFKSLKKDKEVINKVKDEVVDLCEEGKVCEDCHCDKVDIDKKEEVESKIKEAFEVEEELCDGSCEGCEECSSKDVEEKEAVVEKTEQEEKVEEVVEKEVGEVIKPKAAVKQLALNNQLIRTYISIDEAAQHTGIAKELIEDACNGVEGHVFGTSKWMFI